MQVDGGHQKQEAPVPPTVKKITRAQQEDILGPPAQPPVEQDNQYEKHHKDGRIKQHKDPLYRDEQPSSWGITGFFPHTCTETDPMEWKQLSCQREIRSSTWWVRANLGKLMLFGCPET